MLRHLLVLCAAAALLPGCFAGKLNDRALHPSSVFELTPEDLHLPYEIVTVAVEDARLHGWFFPAPDSGDTVLVCPGNSNNKQLMLPMVSAFVSAGYNVAVFDYRGFGLSTGEPDLWSLIPDARAIIERLRTRPDTRRLALLGVSLGSVVALGAAAAEPDAVDAVVAEGVFSPSEKLARLIGGFLATVGGIFITPSGWDVTDHVANLEQPVLFVHGTHDGVTPTEGAARIFAAALDARAPRRFWVAPGAGHAPDIAGRYPEEYATQVRRFLDSQLRRRLTPPTFRARWKHLANGKDGALEVTLLRTNAVPLPAPVPVEICVLPADDEAETVFHHVWFGPGIEPTFRFAVPAPPTFVGARVPGSSVRKTGDGWTRDSRHQHQHAALEANERRLHAKLGGLILRLFGQTLVIAPTDPEPRERRLAACREVEAELRKIVTDDLLPRIRPRYAGLYRTLGGNFSQLGRKREALAAYEQSLLLLPEDVFAHWWFESAWWDFGSDLESVAQTLEQMAKLTADESAAADYSRRAERWRQRLAERSRHLAAWAARQRGAPAP